MGNYKEPRSKQIGISLRKIFTLGTIIGYVVSINNRKIGYIYGHRNIWTAKVYDQDYDKTHFKKKIKSKEEAAGYLYEYMEKS